MPLRNNQLRKKAIVYLLNPMPWLLSTVSLVTLGTFVNRKASIGKQRKCILLLLRDKADCIFFLILGCSHCASPPSVPCYHLSGSCFHRYCGADNWFDARSRCKNIVMNLAVSVIDHQSHPDLQGWLEDSSCNTLWLGYSKEDWYQTTPSGGMYIHYPIKSSIAVILCFVVTQSGDRLPKFNIMQIMPGLEGDLEEWQTQEVNVTRGEAERSMSPEAKPRVTLTSRVCHFSRSPEGPGIICFVIPDSSTFPCKY